MSRNIITGCESGYMVFLFWIIILHETSLQAVCESSYYQCTFTHLLTSFINKQLIFVRIWQNCVWNIELILLELISVHEHFYRSVTSGVSSQFVNFLHWEPLNIFKQSPILWNYRYFGIIDYPPLSAEWGQEEDKSSWKSSFLSQYSSSVRVKLIHLGQQCQTADTLMVTV